PLTGLRTLDLGNNGLEDITPLASLTNLTSLFLLQNRISDISPLRNLRSPFIRPPFPPLNPPGLPGSPNRLALAGVPVAPGQVDLRWNLLDVSTGSVALAVIAQLNSQGYRVESDPQMPLPAFFDGAGLGAPGLAFTNGGHALWTLQTNITHSGVAAAQSGSLYYGQESWLETVVTGPGTLSCWWKVSSQTNSDGLEWLVDGQVQRRISGEVDWQPARLVLPPGQHAVRWRFVRAGWQWNSQNTGWLDQVSFEPGSWVTLAGAPANGHCPLLIQGQPGGVYEVSVSSNLVDWASIGTVTNTTGTAVYNDVLPPGTAPRFYRAIRQP
ncbi:MAG TPA: leucine-rich repeat domain-containing protein, partial [Bacillota bacterium]|nr:leucine-rich repeat domain-containing protein [Bacillota bacterium]